MKTISLYLVPTPIGNLEDITLRALKILQSVDLILAEDTRKSGILLKHFDIKSPLKSFHIHNEHQSLHAMIDDMKKGKVIALISDAGTPGISDPGFLLVRACFEHDLLVSCLPGATALIPALVQSGFPSDSFIFEGFLPHKKGRKKKLEVLSNEKRTIILYESPHRIIKLLNEIQDYFPDHTMLSISREISKIHEENIRGNAKNLLYHFEQHSPKGEFVVVIRNLD